MRWMWVDRFIEFERGKQAKAVKNVSLSEEHLHDHFPGFPVMPQSLIIEGLAQTGGILVGETHNFEHVVILAKIPKMTFHSWACPGESLTYSAVLEDVREEGGMVTVSAHVGERLVADGEIFFAHVPKDQPGADGIDQKSFVFTLLASVLDVGKAGNPSY